MPIRSSATSATVMRSVVAALVVMAVTGCTPSPAPPVPTAGSPTAVRTVPPPPMTPPGLTGVSADHVRSDGLAAAGLHLLVAPGLDAEITDGTVVVVRDVAGTDPVLWLAASAGGRFAAQPDGSVVVHDAGGAVTAGVLAPSGGRAQVVAPDLLDVTPDVRGAPDGTTIDVTVWVSDTALADWTWGDREGGRSLIVTPGDWARAGGDAALTLAWSELIGTEPDADLPTMRDQLACHMIGAPDKPTWNLEPWRPDVGLLAVLLAECNPT